MLGLLLLREFQAFCIYSTPAVERLLRGGNTFFRMLEQLESQASWISWLPGEPFEISPAPAVGALPPGANTAGVICHPVPMPGNFPIYACTERDANPLPRDQALAALLFESMQSGKRFLYAPGLPAVDSRLLSLMDSCDVILVDGTFWTDDELPRIRGQGRTARQMGHMPLSGPGGSLQALASLRRPRKLFIHMNNTNPMLDQSGAEYRAVLDAGWELAHDGMELSL